MSRLVVVLAGPPGAGKTTTAHESGLEVYDRDDACWTSERAFTTALGRIAKDPEAQAAVIRSAASSTARAKACSLVQATHLYLLTADMDTLRRRVTNRDGDARKAMAAIDEWHSRFDHTDQVPLFPGWDTLGPPNVAPTPSTPAPPHTRGRSAQPTGRRAGRTGSRWRALVKNQKAQRLPCWLCAQPIDYTLDWPDPQSFSVDHAKPLSTHPPLAEDPGNLRSAHLSCNSSRGAKDPRPTLGTTSRNW
jgi:hypothetical protein